MKKYSSLLIIVLQSVLLHGQIGTSTPEITRPGPTVASLMNFAEIPVDPHTGVPNISIPLYSFPTHSKDVGVDLSLNYHPAGLSSVDKASDVGVGWNLFGGGVVARTLESEPDEYNRIYHPTWPDSFGDRYSFNFQGRTGRFTIAHDTLTSTYGVALIDDTTLKITYDINTSTNVINSFTIYDEKGYSYIFDVVDIGVGYFQVKGTLPFTVAHAYTDYNAAYHISAIKDNNGKTLVSYTYTNEVREHELFPLLWSYETHKLQTIDVTDIGKAEFNYSYEESLLDSVNDPFWLEDITITDVFSTMVKKFVFDYADLGGEKVKRVLGKVSEFDSEEEDSKDYEFAYESGDPEIGEDYKLDYDLFGYANYTPKCSLDPFGNTSLDTSPSMCTRGALKIINLPTGGQQRFNFESNTYAYYNPYDTSSSGLEEEEYYRNNRDNITPTVYASTSYDSATTTSFPFTVTGSTSKKLFFAFTNVPYYDTAGPNPTEELFVHYELTKDGVSSTTWKVDFSYIDYSFFEYDVHDCLGRMVELEPGNYSISIGVTHGSSVDPLTTTGTISIVEKVHNSTLKRWFYGGGLRIKKISYLDDPEATTPAREINYSYQDFSNSNKSSGDLYDGDWPDPYTNRMGGAQVSYNNVRVYDTGSNGFTKYTYKSFREESLNLTTSFIPHYYAYKQGLLEKKETFNNSGTILSSVENTFSFEDVGDPVFGALSVSAGYGIYTSPTWAKLDSSDSKSFTYDAGSAQHENKTTETFTYNSTNRQIDEHTVTNSVGEVLMTKNYYHTGNSTLSDNRISELEKVETYRDTELLSKSKINYSNSFTDNVAYLPETVDAAKGTDSLETRLRYVAYDEWGNPLQVQQENGTPISYIWGYHKTVPIAKIENLDYASISSTAIEDLQAKSDEAGTEADVLSLLNDLRDAYPNAMITSMTYKPLIGIHTITDPKKDSIRYDYDTFGRLIRMWDKNHHLLSENEYHYADPLTTGDHNYIKTRSYKQAFTSTPSSPAITDIVEGVTYYDGLGRAIEKIAGKQSGNGKDLVTPIYYDAIGRQAKEYLPYASTQDNMAYIATGSLKDAISSQYNTKYGENYPYSEKRFEASPLNRVLEQAAPGTDWSLSSTTKHTVRLNYQTNVGNEVKLYGAVADVGSNTITLVNDAGTVYFDKENLYKTITKNENWKTGDGTNNTIENFKDKEGHVVLERKFDGMNTYNTYYVYDQYGNLTFVLPPIVSGAIDQDVLDDLCYQYKYDYRNRLIEKKLPGKKWEYIAYNNQDKPVATGPALNPFGGTDEGWLITKYDALGRVAYTGWYEETVSSAKRGYIEAGITSWAESFSTSTTTIDGIQVSYTNDIAPTSIKLLTVNYYDGYEYYGAPSSIATAVDGQSVLENVKGLPTGSWVRVLTDPGEDAAEQSYVLYDSKARPIRTYKKNYLGGFTQVDSKLTFGGRVDYTITTHTRKAVVFTILDEYFYTDQDRLWKHDQTVDDHATETISENHYDNHGMLIRKDVGGTGTPYQMVDYSYNIRGWLTGINNVGNLNHSTDPTDLFAFGINYNGTVANTDSGTIVPQYNGNIAETTWRSATDNIKRRYGYVYDYVNRMTNSVYQKPDNSSPMTNMYDEKVHYDLNGNITDIYRTGDLDSNIYAANAIDNLEYVYDTDKKNLLLKVTDGTNNPKGFTDDSDGTNDTTDDYTYDDYGNLTSDQNKKITEIVYNHLNLPTQINFDGGNKIEYLYNAAGLKERKTVTVDTTETVTDYLDGFQYTNEMLDFFPHAEGYVKASYCPICDEGDKYKFNYVYQYKDHLGNIRLSYAWDEKDDVLKVIEENHYYPYGLKHTNYNVGKKVFEIDEEMPDITKLEEVEFGQPDMNKYKYNGKEWQDELGLNMYSMDMRQYDPAIARWVVQDPVIHHSQSPYNGYDGNPVVFADPSGGSISEMMGKDIYGNQRYTDDGQFIKIADRDENVTGLPSGEDEDVSGSNELYSDAGDDQKDPTGKNANPNNGLEEYRAWRDYPGYHDGETWFDRFCRNVNSVHIDIMRDEGSGGGLMYGGFGRLARVEKVAAAEKLIAAEKLAAKTTLELESSIAKAMGRNYKIFGEVSVPIKNTELLEKLNSTSKGNWVKVYEAGLKNGKKIETHYFRNNSTMEVFDVKIKYPYWHQTKFKKIEP